MNKAQLKKDIKEFDEFLYNTALRLESISNEYSKQYNMDMALLFAGKADAWRMVRQDYFDHFKHVLTEGR